MKLLFMIGILMALLDSTNTAQQPEPPPFPVALNHFYLTLDAATFKEIQNSPFLRKEFAPSEERTTVRKDTTYTGLYFYGVHTYFEFFDAAQEKSRKIGDSAIAFGVEQRGASRILQKRAGDRLPMQIAPITRQLGEAQIPWFLMLSASRPQGESGFNSWTMEYDARFLSEWHSEIKDHNQGITRREILQRYVAVLKETPAKPYLRDVLAITLAADRSATELLTRQGELFGYAWRTENAATILTGDDFTLRLIPETSSARGIQQITLRVNRQPEKSAEYHFGAKSVLKFNGDGTATWSF